MSCDSGLRLPVVDGRPTCSDASFWYGRAACGYVVRIPRTADGVVPDVGARLDDHTRRAHPARWQEIEFHRAMSAD